VVRLDDIRKKQSKGDCDADDGISVHSSELEFNPDNSGKIDLGATVQSIEISHSPMNHMLLSSAVTSVSPEKKGRKPTASSRERKTEVFTPKIRPTLHEKDANRSRGRSVRVNKDREPRIKDISK